MIRILLLLAFGAVPLSATPRDTFVHLDHVELESLDPVWPQDPLSRHIIDNLYEGLIRFSDASLDRFVPTLATRVPSEKNGLIGEGGRLFRFPIREGILFHDGSPLTPEDVRYSFLRHLFSVSNEGSPSPLLGPLFGIEELRKLSPERLREIHAEALRKISVQGNEFRFRLNRPYAPTLSTIASSFRILSKAWAISQGEWNGEAETFPSFVSRKKEDGPLHAIANGTGNYRLERWDRKNRSVFLLRNDAHRGPRPRLRRIVIRTVEEFGTRRLMLVAGDADSITAETAELSVLRNHPDISVQGFNILWLKPVVYFNIKVSTPGSPATWSGKLDGNGVPGNFSADPDVRQGFAYAAPYERYVEEVLGGEGTVAQSYLPASMALPGKEFRFRHDRNAPNTIFEPPSAENFGKKGFA